LTTYLTDKYGTTRTLFFDLVSIAIYYIGNIASVIYYLSIVVIITIKDIILVNIPNVIMLITLVTPMVRIKGLILIYIPNIILPIILVTPIIFIGVIIFFVFPVHPIPGHTLPLSPEMYNSLPINTIALHNVNIAPIPEGWTRETWGARGKFSIKKVSNVTNTTRNVSR